LIYYFPFFLEAIVAVFLLSIETVSSRIFKKVTSLRSKQPIIIMISPSSIIHSRKCQFPWRMAKKIGRSFPLRRYGRSFPLRRAAIDCFLLVRIDPKLPNQWRSLVKRSLLLTSYWKDVLSTYSTFKMGVGQVKGHFLMRVGIHIS